MWIRAGFLKLGATASYKSSTLTTRSCLPPVKLSIMIPSLFLALPTNMPFSIAFDDNKFLVLWRFDDQADKMYYFLRVKTTGWIGFGFAEKASNNMMDYDVIVGGFSNGKGYLSVSFQLPRQRQRQKEIMLLA